jgi:hypothetical protein
MFLLSDQQVTVPTLKKQHTTIAIFHIHIIFNHMNNMMPGMNMLTKRGFRGDMNLRHAVTGLYYKVKSSMTTRSVKWRKYSDLVQCSMLRLLAESGAEGSRSGFRAWRMSL